MLRKKTIQHVLEEAEGERDESLGPGLAKVLSVFDVIAYGLGSTIGAGIFVITGQGALTAGPAIVVSFLLASLSCLFSAFSYSEFAARVPVSGSAYTFTYVCLGEAAAWFIGWNLTLEYMISSAAVARGWTYNVYLFFQQIGAHPPSWINKIDVSLGGGHSTSISFLSTAIIVACTVVLLIGVKESARFNLVMTILNIAVIMFIIILGSQHVNSANWTSAAPEHLVPSGCSSTASYFPCGINGVISGAAKVFFSFVGFDSVTTLAGLCVSLCVLLVSFSFPHRGGEEPASRSSDWYLCHTFDRYSLVLRLSTCCHWFAALVPVER